MCYEGIDTVRQNCGGAGYNNQSGLPQLHSDYSPVPVYEGDNTVLAQQNLNYFQKLFRLLKNKQPVNPMFEYVRHLDDLVKTKQEARTIEDF